MPISRNGRRPNAAGAVADAIQLCTPKLSSSVRCRFASGVSFGYRMWRPPLSCRRRRRPAAAECCAGRARCSRPCRCRTSASRDRAACRRRRASTRSLLEQIRELRHVVGVDLRHLRDLLRLLLVMRDRVMRVRHADLRIGHAAELAAEHERDDARQVALIREHLQVAHQLDVIVVRRRDAGRVIDDRQLLVALLLGPLDAPLDVANRIEILDRASARSLCAERALQLRDLLAHRIEHAALLAGCAPAAPCGSVLPLSPNSRSNTARGLFSVGSGVLALRQEIVLV